MVWTVVKLSPLMLCCSCWKLVWASLIKARLPLNISSPYKYTPMPWSKREIPRSLASKVILQQLSLGQIWIKYNNIYLWAKNFISFTRTSKFQIFLFVNLSSTSLILNNYFYLMFTRLFREYHPWDKFFIYHCDDFTMDYNAILLKWHKALLLL